MNHSIKVSVIVPIYNAEKHLKRTLESISSQTYKDFELILVNDGSTDTSVKIIEQFIDDNREVTTKIINNTKSEGAAVARNRGIREATGKYVYFCDADDIMKNNLLEECVTYLEKNNLEMIRFNASLVEANCTTESYNSMKGLKTGVYSTDIFLNADRKNVSHVVWSYMFMKSLLENNKLFFEEGITFEDTLFITHTFFYVNKIGYINQPLYLYYQGHSSVMMNNKKNGEKSSKSLVFILRKLRDFKTKKINNFSKIYLEFYEDFQIHLYFQMLSLNPLSAKDSTNLFFDLEIPRKSHIIMRKYTSYVLNKLHLR